MDDYNFSSTYSINTRNLHLGCKHYRIRGVWRIFGIFQFLQRDNDCCNKTILQKAGDATKVRAIRRKKGQHLTVPGQLKPGSMVIFLSISFHPARL